MSYEQLLAIALEFEGVEEGMSYRQPAVKRNGRGMFGLKGDGETVAIKVDWATHDRMLEEHPEVFFKTERYDSWPWFLVRLPLLTEALAAEIIRASWEDAPKPAKVMKAP